MHHRSLLISLASSFTLAVLGCSAGPGDNTGGNGASGPNGGGPSAGGGTSSFGNGGGGEGAGFSSGGNGSGGGSCAGEDYVPSKVPLDMYIMQDQSGSMDDP